MCGGREGWHSQPVVGRRMQPLVGSVDLVQGLMVWITPAVGISVISRLRRVAMAIYFDLWPVRVGTAPPQSLQSCFRVAVAIHCSFTEYFYSRIQRQRSPSRHLWRVGVQRLVQRFRFVFDNGTGEGHSYGGGSHLVAR